MPFQPHSRRVSIMFAYVTILQVVHCAALPPSHAEEPLPRQAYAIVVRAAIPILPPPLRDFFEANPDRLTTPRASVAGASSPDSNTHFVMLDVSAASDDFPALQQAAHEFPRKEQVAKKLLRRNGVKSGGRLPWALVESYERLIRAMRQGRSETIQRESRKVLELATDAALPFNTTRLRNRGGWGDLGGPDRCPPGTDLTACRVRDRYHLILVSRNVARLRYEVRVAPERFRVVDNPLNEVFATLLESHRVLGDWIASDMRIAQNLEIADAQSFTDSADEFFKQLADRTIPALESRLEEAALLGANLIGTAWEKADRPGTTFWKSEADTADQENTLEKEPPFSFVASRKSKVFHRSTCPHTKRIKPANLVEIKSAESALEGGRRPCRTCNPTGGRRRQN